LVQWTFFLLQHDLGLCRVQEGMAASQSSKTHTRLLIFVLTMKRLLYILLFSSLFCGMAATQITFNLYHNYETTFGYNDNFGTSGTQHRHACKSAAHGADNETVTFHANRLAGKLNAVYVTDALPVGKQFLSPYPTIRNLPMAHH
jgi:hypothetical protein